jgi:hypothetical protein
MEAIKYYVKGAFVGVAETPAVLEQQEELIADLTAKVADLVADGRAEDEALGMAIASMGDLSGLVKEFATDEIVPTGPPAPATTEVYAARLRLHVVALAAGGAIGLLFVLSVLAALSGVASGTTVVVDLLLGMTAVGWIGFELWRFHQGPDAIETVEVVTTGLRTRILQWVAVCAVALVFNLIDSNGFWAWTVWVGAAAWPASIYVQQQLLARGKFLHPTVETAASVSAEAMAVGAAAPGGCA